MIRFGICLFVCVFLRALVCAGEAGPQERPPFCPEILTVHPVGWLSEPPKIDGQLDDACWQ